MSKIIAIAGFSGSGKSTSLRFLPPEQTFIINANSKQLSIPGFRKNYIPLHIEAVKDGDGKPVMVKKKDGTQVQKKAYVGNYFQGYDYEKVFKVIKAIPTLKNIKYVVFDDINYMLGQDTLSMALTPSRDKYSVFAYNYNELISRLMALPDNMYVIVISHLMTDIDGNVPFYRMISNSKYIDKQAPIDGRFSYILYAEKLVDELNDKVRYVFRTRSNGNDTCRSVYGCFKDKYIRPNMKEVIDYIEAFENGEVDPCYPDDDWDDSINDVEVKPASNGKKEEKKKDDSGKKDKKASDDSFSELDEF